MLHNASACCFFIAVMHQNDAHRNEIEETIT